MLTPSLSATFAALCLAVSACQTAPEPTQVREERLFEVVALENADASAIHRSLAGVFTGSSMRVESDPRTNSLILAGGPDEMARAKDVIAQLDVEVVAQGPLPAFEMIELKNALASEVHHSLRGLMNEHSAQILVDPRTNALLVMADPGSMTRIKELVAQFDRAQ